MSGIVCNCADPEFGNTGLPGCAIEQKALAFPILVPRFGASGLRNVIAVTSATIGADITAKTTAADPRDRWYPMPRVENATFPRTDTEYETAESQRKYKLDGVGGIRSWIMELWAKSAVAGMHRELSKYGCVEMDVYYVDITGAIFGIKDNPTDTDMHGYPLASGTFDVFKEYATNTTVQKLMVSWDLDSDTCEQDAYAITSDQLGYKATDLRGLLTANQVLTEPADGTVIQVVRQTYGSAAELNPVVGLNFTTATVSMFNVTQGVAMTAPTGYVNVVDSDGEYTFAYLTAEADQNDILRVSVSLAPGYDVQDATFEHTYA